MTILVSIACMLSAPALHAADIEINWWTFDGGGDLDGDGDTDQSDLGMLLADWGCGT